MYVFFAYDKKNMISRYPIQYIQHTQHSTYLLFSVQSTFDNILLFNDQLIICTHLL